MQPTDNSRKGFDQQQSDPDDLPPPYSPPEANSLYNVPTAPHLSDIRYNDTKISHPSSPDDLPTCQPSRSDTVPDASPVRSGSSIGSMSYEASKSRRRNRCCGASCKKPVHISDSQRNSGQSIPPSFVFPQDLTITIRGFINGGRINILQQDGHESFGCVETTVDASDRVLEKATYRLDRGQETIFDIKFPSAWFFSWGARVEMTIKMPYHANSLIINTSNMPIEVDRRTSLDVLHLRTSNQSIKIKDDWDGKRISLETTNSSINTDRARIYAEEAVDYSTTNAEIKVDKVIVSEGGSLYIRTSNAKIEGRELRAGSSLKLKTSNAKIDVAYISAQNGTAHIQTSNSNIEAQDIQAQSKIDLITSNASINVSHLKSLWIDVKTSNSGIDLGRVLVADRITAETSFGKLNASVETLSPDLYASFITSFSKANVHMPIDFQGRFDVTGDDAEIVILDVNELKFIVNDQGHKQGFKRSDRPGAVFVKTNNSTAQLAFDTAAHFPK